MFDGEAIFVPQRSQGKGVARRLAEFEEGGAGLCRRSEVSRISEWRHGGLENGQRIGEVSDEGMSGVAGRMKVAANGWRNRIGAS